MNKQSENKATSLQEEPNKLNPSVDELNEQELNQVSGGTGKAPTTSSKEIEDYSFDIEQVLNIGSK
ncbi:MAG: bacteriocin [Bradyrhizobium sp.]|nr:bacteriocin [Bradyrhizobium sp.]